MQMVKRRGGSQNDVGVPAGYYNDINMFTNMQFL